MLRPRIMGLGLGQDEGPFPEEVTIPGQVDQGAIDQATADARRKKIMLVGGLSVLGAVIVLGAALMYATQEPRSRRERHALRTGERRCIGRVKYAVLPGGRLKRVGNC